MGAGSGWLGGYSSEEVLGRAGEQQAELSITHPHGNNSTVEAGLQASV